MCNFSCHISKELSKMFVEILPHDETQDPPVQLSQDEDIIKSPAEDNDVDTAEFQERM